ncbi:unnamed protein product [Strongylus vulgaris]|uniref:Uncharacterized protein n=1 Tax=Strongylus vulgaris TaxID=40348 RepID=A0A3P7IX31_STRVU|nr:unnamed protein product [Strongylus vulgaris]
MLLLMVLLFNRLDFLTRYMFKEAQRISVAKIIAELFISDSQFVARMPAPCRDGLIYPNAIFESAYRITFLIQRDVPTPRAIISSLGIVTDVLLAGSLDFAIIMLDSF